MPSAASRLVPLILRATGRGKPLSSAAAADRRVVERALRPRPFGPPRLRDDVEVSVEHDGWAVYTVSPAGGRARHRAVYLHGGGWVNEIEPAHWRFIAALAAETQSAVRVPIYPLVPWGTAGEVVPRVAELVSAEIDGAGPRPTFVLGDSAGGQIALSSAIWLRDRGFDQPARTFLIAPVLDAAMANPEIAAVEPRDPWLSRPGIGEYARYWRGELSIDDPLVSPLSAALGGLTALTVFTGTRDILNPDAHLLAGEAAAAGVDVDFVEGEGMVHVYPLLPIPEGRAARRHIVDTINGTPPRVA
jgi:acetyl esterase/lipase